MGNDSYQEYSNKVKTLSNGFVNQDMIESINMNTGCKNNSIF